MNYQSFTELLEQAQENVQIEKEKIEALSTNLAQARSDLSEVSDPLGREAFAIEAEIKNYENALYEAHRKYKQKVEDEAPGLYKAITEARDSELRKAEAIIISKHQSKLDEAVSVLNKALEAVSADYDEVAEKIRADVKVLEEYRGTHDFWKLYGVLEMQMWAVNKMKERAMNLELIE
ncbi:hypothetical protein NHG25_08435 [Aerococcaceae bacterium NML191292]|nr:hypothetical protein [Aerococcaceae bacterium NML210727]MCW6655361.1 hypothetical protein [Aerococcaceae bacterium NML201296]MCW6660505.1 hypothetical protein [Aerococcaceae bacterium NML191292]MCW6662257.1 hypothetical protein [Aerococcaceae bacterium NML201209]